MNAFAGRPLVVDTKANLIRQRLAEAIINGELRPGDRIVLDEIARELGVSKIPLREALSSLEGAGLVVTTPHAGPRVAPLPRHEIRGVYQLREAVEPLAMRLALERDAARLADELREVDARMRAEIGNHGDDTTISALNAEFHLTIARATTFQTVVESVEGLLVKIRRYRAAGFASAWEGVLEEHEAIVDAVASGDVEHAVAAVHAHVHARGAGEAPDELEVVQEGGPRADA